MNNSKPVEGPLLSPNYVAIAFVGVAYLLSSLFGSLLGFPPANAAPLWPAAGVAVAALIIGGVGLWPGILLGDILYNLINHPIGDSVSEELMWSVIDSLGPTLQAVLGAVYIAKNLQKNLGGDFANLIKSYLIGVLLVCTISPSFGASALLFRELISSEILFSTWFSWWVGDAIGVMMFTPIILLLAFNIKNARIARDESLLQMASPSIVMLIVLVFTILWFHNSERNSILNSLNGESDQVAQIFSERLAGAIGGFESLKRYISVEDTLDEEAISSYVAQIDDIGIEAIAWLPRVENASLANTLVVPGFENTRGLAITTLNSELEYVPVERKSEYFPVVYISSDFFGTRLEGFDPSSIPQLLRQLEIASDNNETVLSNTFSLGIAEFPYLLFYTPVYHDNVAAIAASAQERRQSLKGFIAGVVEPSSLVPAEYFTKSSIPLAFLLIEKDEDSGLILNPNESMLIDNGELVDSQSIAMFGRNLEWRAYVHEKFWVAGGSLESRLFLTAALVCVLFFSLMTSNMISRSRMIREKVIERTKELNIERAKLGQALDIANILTWSIELPSRLVIMDDRSYEFFRTDSLREGGYSLQIEKWLKAFVHEEDRASLLREMFEQDWSVDVSASKELEGRVYRRDGALRNVIFRFSAQFDTQGKVVGLIGTAQDVTQSKEMLLALKNSEEYNRSIIESSQDCIAIHALNGAVLDMTPQGMKLMGISERAEILKVDWLSFWKREQDSTAYNKAVVSGRRGETARFQGCAVTFAGEQKWWDVNISPIHDAAGNVVKLLSVTRDITIEHDSISALERLNSSLEDEVKLRTLEFAESEKRYRSMFESNPIPMWIFDDDTLKFTGVNQAAIENYGYSAEEFLQMSILDIWPAEERGLEQERLAKKGKNSARKIEGVTHVRKDGSRFHVDITSHEITEAGRKYRIVLSNDITERLNANAELRRQQDLTRLILENLAEGVVACDADGELILFNKAAREWHGTDPREMPAERWGDYYSLFEADGVTPLVTERIPLVRAFNGEQVRNSEMSICRKEEQQRFVVASGEPLMTSDGEKVGAVVVMHDITGRKNTQLKLEDSARQLLAANEQVENERAKLAERVEQRTAQLTISNEQLQVAKAEAEAASRAKSSFLAVMSHEIRTPMNGIVGMVDVLSHSNLEEQHSSYVKTIKDSAFSLLGIIDDILDFSKIEASKMELERAQFSLVQVSESVVDTLSVLSKDNGVAIKVFVEPTLPRLIWGDPKRLRQVLMNLVGNAIKFSSGRPGKKGEVRICVETDKTQQDHFIISVKDNGIGISAEQMPNLFNSFSQAETSTTRVFGGTGLGLAISKRLVELMDGSIEARSEYGRGSEFSIRLPLELVSANESTHVFDAVDLEGLKCVLVNFENEQFQDLHVYLSKANADVARVGDLETAALLHKESTEEDFVVVCNTELNRPCDARLEALVAEHKGLKVFLINSGRRCNPRILRPGLVSMDDVFIRQYEFLHGVAVTAGRASALGVEEAQESLRLDKVQALSIAEARALGKLILVAEDDKTNQKVILRQLSMLGHAAEVAGNGLEAWQMWQSGHYACVITDLHMPKMDGYSLTKKIRAQEGDSARTPILMLTANALSGEAEKAKKLGVDQYLTKPLQLKVLNEALSKWVPKGNVDAETIVTLEEKVVQNSCDKLDLTVLHTAIGDDSAVLNEVLSDYLESALELREELFIAAVKGQIEKIGSLAHRLKGSSRMVGAIHLGDLCAELENAGRSEDLDAVKNFMPAMDAELKILASNIRDAIAA